MPRRSSSADRRGLVQLGAGGRVAPDAVPAALSVLRAVETPVPCPSEHAADSGPFLDHWELWFPAMPGPLRTKTRNGVKTRVQRLELPPTMNDRLHHYAKARWVKQWRSRAYFMARSRGLPRLERVRISMIVYRERIGVADPDNDWGRAKPLIDGLRDAGALAKDTHKYLTIGSIEERRSLEQGILLIVEALAHAAPTAGEGEE